MSFCIGDVLVLSVTQRMGVFWANVIEHDGGGWVVQKWQVERDVITEQRKLNNRLREKRKPLAPERKSTYFD